MIEREKPPVSKEEARMIINATMAEVYSMGANDSEIPELNRILDKLEKEEISPDDAVREAESIKARKQDYH